MAIKTWVPNRYRGLSRRLACRLYLYCKDLPDPDITYAQVLDVVFGAGKGANKVKNPPMWWKNLGAELRHYNPYWTDWTTEEKQYLITKLLEGFDPALLKKCLSVPDSLMRACIEESMEVNYMAHERAISGADALMGKFEEEVPVDVDDDLSEYADRVNLSNPVSRATVATLVLLERKIAELCKKLLVTTDLRELAQLAQTFATLREQYSSAAEDVAQLEKQQEIRKEGETLDDVIKRAKEVLPDWRNRYIELLLEESGLIEHTVKLHKVDLLSQITNVAEQKPTRTGDVMNFERFAGPFMETSFDGDSDDAIITE